MTTTGSDDVAIWTKAIEDVIFRVRDLSVSDASHVTERKHL
jgi:hypothetical protein